jgi:3-hydroxyisobutyrate dehydrogenase
MARSPYACEASALGGSIRRQRKEILMKVAILGAGRMGSAMALRLLDTGHQVTVWNRDPGRLAPLADAGASVADDITAAVAEARVVITMVTDGAAVRSVAMQMLPAMPMDAAWVQASTVGAEWADRLRALADEHGRTVLDAPVSGSTGPARNGTLTWLVAGPHEAVDAARPVLDALGQRLLVVGARQEASRLKLIINAWMTAATVAMADALRSSDELGVARDALLDVLSGGPLGMPYALQKAQQMTARDYEPGFPVELALKDIRLIEEVEQQTSPLVRELDRRLTSAADAGHARDDLAAVAAVA